jgi:DNA-binding transcriptional LysR family regulator
VQVRELEGQLDVQPLDRTTRRVALTKAGEALAHGLKRGSR